MAVCQSEFLWRDHLRQDSQRTADAGEDHRRGDDAEGNAYVLHALPLHASDQGRFLEDDRRGLWTRPALVLRQGGVWDAGVRLRGEVRGFSAGGLVRGEKETGEEGRDAV